MFLIMTKRRIKISRKMLFTWLMLAGLIILLTPQTLTGKFQLTFAHIFSWPLSMGRNISLSASMQQPLTDVVNRTEYNKLRNHLANTTQWLDQERQKVEKLSGLRERSVWQGVNFVLADVIVNQDKLENKLIINRGKNDGLAKGQFVLGDYSIIGVISDVEPRTAKVNLITDPASKIPVRVAQTNAGTIMQGTGNSLARISLLPAKYKIKVEDVVFAQERPGVLDTPIIVGTVAQCKIDQKNPLLWDITVRPACDIEKLKKVDVVIMNPQPIAKK